MSASADISGQRLGYSILVIVTSLSGSLVNINKHLDFYFWC